MPVPTNILFAHTPVTLGSINDWFVTHFFRGPGLTAHAQDADALFLFILWLSIISFVGLMGAMCYWVIKYRRKPGVPAQRSAHHNTPLEIAWTVIPLLILTVVFFWGFHGYMVAAVAKGTSEEATLKAQRWAWQLTYANGAQSQLTTRLNVNDTPIFVVPAGRPFKIRMYSIDVMHAFWIPDFRIKFDVFPNRYTSMWFEPKAEHIGDHWVFCAEYCGDSHSDMAAILRVVPEAEYQQIISGWSVPTDAPPAKLGEIFYKTKGCNACHSIDGSRNTGPTWKNAYGHPVRFTDGTELDLSQPDAWANYIRESILMPARKIHEGYPNQMALQQLTDKEIDSLIAYYRALSDRGGTVTESEATPPPAPEDPKPQG